MYISNITKGINFQAGKVHLYSDFDGTYCPCKHSSLHNPDANKHMAEYCSKMDKFFKSTEGDLHFHVTTGRTFGEYEAISWLLKMRNFRLPLPESFIAKNGSDEYLKRRDNDEKFYNNDKFPFKKSDSSKIKEEYFAKTNNWKGAEIKDYIRSLAWKYKIKLIEADSENSVKDYGNNSLFSEGKLNPDEWKKLPAENNKIKEHVRPIAEYSIGSRNDGNLKMHLIFSPDYGFCPERNWIYDNFMDNLKDYLKKQNVKYHMSWDLPSSKNFYRTSCSITPEFEGGELTKLYDTKMALKNAIKNNDILITAGDGSNDFEMLNPLEYIDKSFLKDCEAKSKNKKFYQNDMFGKLKDLQAIYSGDNREYIKSLKKELEENGLLKKIEDLPFCGIVIKKDNSKLSILKDTFSSIGKIVEVDSGNIDEGIKQAVKKYADKNKNFKSDMSSNFKEFIFGITKKKDYKNLIWILGAGFVSIVGFLIYKQKVKNNENTK